MPRFERVARIFLLLLLLGGALYSFSTKSSLIKAAPLSAIPGSVINIPVGGFDVPWVVSSYQDNGYVLVMAMNNICGISGSYDQTFGCIDANGDYASTNGTSWNSGMNNTGPVLCTTNANSGYCNQITAFPKSRNYFIAMDSIYYYFPATIGGLPKEDVIRAYATLTSSQNSGWHQMKNRPRRSVREMVN